MRPTLMQVNTLNISFGQFEANTFVARRDFMITDAASAEVLESISTSLRAVRKPGDSCGAKDPAQAKPLASPQHMLAVHKVGGQGHDAAAH